MKRVCLGLGVGLMAMGLAVYELVYGYAFAGLLLAAVGLLLTAVGVLLWLKPKAPRLCRGLLIALGILCAAGILTAAVTGGFVLANANTSPSPESRWAIVLGAGVNGTQPSRSLRERLDGAAEYLKQYPQSLCVVSGGQGSGEDITEAQCMYDGLVQRGIEPDRIYMEEQATNTRENIRLSLELIEKETGTMPEQVTVITSEYHLLRAKGECGRYGVEARGFSCRTVNPIFRFQSYLREIPAIWLQLLRS